MPRISNNRSSIDDLKYIDITTLRKNGFLKPGKRSKGTLEWSKNGNVISSIAFDLIMYDEDGIINIAYNTDTTKNIAYSITIVSTLSNLGKGLIYFFECPKTNKMCRKLHLYNGEFAHRSAFDYLIYSKQKISKKEREIDFICKFILDDEVHDEVEKKYFKKYYNGKPTKKYLKFLKHMNFKEQNYSYLQNRFDTLFYKF